MKSGRSHGIVNDGDPGDNGVEIWIDKKEECEDGLHLLVECRARSRTIALVAVNACTRNALGSLSPFSMKEERSGYLLLKLCDHMP